MWVVGNLRPEAALTTAVTSHLIPRRPRIRFAHILIHEPGPFFLFPGGQVGTLLLLELPHQGDEEPVLVTVRAVQKMGSAVQFYVVAHVVEPRCVCEAGRCR